jgi:hypothetical protein
MLKVAIVAKVVSPRLRHRSVVWSMATAPALTTNAATSEPNGINFDSGNCQTGTSNFHDGRRRSTHKDAAYHAAKPKRDQLSRDFTSILPFPFELLIKRSFLGIARQLEVSTKLIVTITLMSEQSKLTLKHSIHCNPRMI